MGASSSLVPILSRGARIIGRFPGGSSVIEGGALVFACHRVAPLDPRGIRANEELKVSPEYLDFFVRRLRSLRYAIISLDELVEVVLKDRKTQGLVSLTFDDGYRDNLENALPILDGLRAPFVVYALCGLEGRAAFFWWFAVEAFLHACSAFRLPGRREMSCRTPRDKERAFHSIRRMVLQKASADAREFLVSLLPGFESMAPIGLADRYIMNDSQLKLLSKCSMVTIGCHTVTHPNLVTLTEGEVEKELGGSKMCLERVLGKKVQHLAFPFGGRTEAGEREFRLASQAGFVTAATMVAGSVKRGGTGSLLRLPRIPVREGADPLDLVAENRARIWLAKTRGTSPA